MVSWQDCTMPEFAPFEFELKTIQRRQAFRFGIPVLVFVLLALVLGGAVYFAQQEEREQAQSKLIADTLWARQNIQFQMDGLANSLLSLVQASAAGSAQRFNGVCKQVLRSYPELSMLYRGKNLEPLSCVGDESASYNPDELPDSFKSEIFQRIQSLTPGFAGPVELRGRNFVAAVSFGPEGRVMVGLVDLGRMLDKELPWWFARDNEVELLDARGVVHAALRKGKDGQGVFVHQTILELGGVPLQIRVNSGESGPQLFNYAVSAAMLFLLGLLLLSFVLLFRDSRRRLNIEAKLQEEKLFRQSMQDSIALGMRVWDLTGTIRYVNPAFCRIVGYDAAELVGRPMPMPYWPQNYTEDYRKLVAKVIAGKAPRDGFESVYQHKDGRLIHVLIVEAPLKDSRGAHVGWMSSVLDITDRKNSELVISEQREKLQAASRFALVGEVASNIAHELNQPLATMVSFAQAGVNLSRKGASIERYAELFEKIRDQAQRASRVVGGVQNLVRKRQPEREWVTAEQMVQSIWPILDTLIQKHEVRIHVQLDQEVTPALFLDRIMVEQALVNLIKNSAEAFRTDQLVRNIWLRSKATEENYVFEVQDDGPGVSLPDSTRMFEALFSTKADGLGLGLSLCKSVAEAHGGRLRAEAVPTGGSLFRIDLPMALQEQEREHHE